MRIFEAKVTYRLVSEGSSIQLESPTAILGYLQTAFDDSPLQEIFYVVFLDRKHRALGRQLISIGTLVATLVSPRDVFRGAILAGAASIVVSHNHPSGDPSPSVADHRVTKILSEAAEILEITLIDHLIVGTKASDPLGKGFYSFREAGLL